jgi:hypothetical protein
MAKRQVVSYSYTCDVCGDEIAETDAATASRKVSWEGSDYTLDVCSAHGSKLDAVLGTLMGFVNVSHRAGGRGRRRSAPTTPSPGTRAPRARRAASSTPSTRSTVGAMREWAQANGYNVGDRGRIPASVVAAYEAATTSAQTNGTASANGTSPAPAAPRARRPRKAKAPATAAATASAPAEVAPADSSV